MALSSHAAVSNGEIHPTDWTVLHRVCVSRERGEREGSDETESVCLCLACLNETLRERWVRPTRIHRICIIKTRPESAPTRSLQRNNRMPASLSSELRVLQLSHVPPKSHPSPSLDLGACGCRDDVWRQER
jgi:hypothetical protein